MCRQRAPGWAVRTYFTVPTFLHCGHLLGTVALAASCLVKPQALHEMVRAPTLATTVFATASMVTMLRVFQL